MIRFIEHILDNDEYDYVYFVSIEQALEWLKYPRKLNELDDFWAFSCSEIIYEYDIDCSDKEFDSINKDDDKKTTTNDQADSQLKDRQGESLFRSDLVMHSIWIFLLLILSVLFYDKYFASKS